MNLQERVSRAYRRGGISELIKGGYEAGVRSSLLPAILLFKGGDILTAADLADENIEGKNIWHVSQTDESTSSTSVDDIIPVGLSENSEYFHKTKNYDYSHNFVFNCENGRLLGPSGIVITEDKHILKTSVSPPLNNDEIVGINKALSKFPLTTVRSLFSQTKAPQSESGSLGTVFPLFKGSTSYYYAWTLVAMLKIQAAEYYASQTGIQPTFIIPENPQPYVIESLSLLGYEENDWIKWDGPVMQADNIITPSYPQPSPERLKWLQSRVLETIPDREFDQYKESERVYISRHKSNRRKIKNEQEVTNALSELGFHRYFAENLSFKEQVKLFAGAEYIISPHGAGLTNMVWAKDASIIEIFNDYITDPYYIIARNLGHDYTAMRASSMNPVEKWHSDMKVDVDELRDVLENELD